MKKLSIFLALGCLMSTPHKANAAACKDALLLCLNAQTLQINYIKSFASTYKFLSGCDVDDESGMRSATDECRNAGGISYVALPWAGEDRASFHDKGIPQIRDWYRDTVADLHADWSEERVNQRADRFINSIQSELDLKIG